jgi:hypothetical protein
MKDVSISSLENMKLKELYELARHSHDSAKAHSFIKRSGTSIGNTSTHDRRFFKKGSIPSFEYWEIFKFYRIQTI